MSGDIKGKSGHRPVCGPAGLVLPPTPALLLGSSAIGLRSNSGQSWVGAVRFFSPEVGQAYADSLHAQERQGPGEVSLLISVSRGPRGGSHELVNLSLQGCLGHLLGAGGTMGVLLEQLQSPWAHYKPYLCWGASSAPPLHLPPWDHAEMSCSTGYRVG